jgi:hypothetical protein
MTPMDTAGKARKGCERRKAQGARPCVPSSSRLGEPDTCTFNRKGTFLSTEHQCSLNFKKAISVRFPLFLVLSYSRPGSLLGSLALDVVLVATIVIVNKNFGRLGPCRGNIGLKARCDKELKAASAR